MPQPASAAEAAIDEPAADAVKGILDLERAVRARDLLVAIVAHDLRSPLAAAQVSAELILRSCRDEPVLRSARRVLSATRRMQRLTEQLLDVARVRAGLGLPVRRRQGDLSRVCEAAVEEVRAGEPQARIALVRRGDARVRF